VIMWAANAGQVMHMPQFAYGSANGIGYRSFGFIGVASGITGPGMVGPGSKFQVRPKIGSECDPYRAQSSHSGGMNVAMADGSVKFLSASIDPNNWWALCTLASGEVVS